MSKSIANLGRNCKGRFLGGTTTGGDRDAAVPVNKDLVLYEADRSTRFKALSSFSFLQCGWWGSQAGFDIWSMISGQGQVDVGGTEIFAVAPELVMLGTGGSVAFLALVRFYASKLVGKIELSPCHSKVSVSTHTMFGTPSSREVSTSAFTRSPHPSTAYYLFKLESDRWYTMIDRDIGTFWNEPKLVRLIDGRITMLAHEMSGDVLKSRSMENSKSREETNVAQDSLITAQDDVGETHSTLGETGSAKRAASNKMRKRKKQMRKRNRGEV